MTPADLRAHGRDLAHRPEWGANPPLWHTAMVQADWEVEAHLLDKEISMNNLDTIDVRIDNDGCRDEPPDPTKQDAQAEAEPGREVQAGKLEIDARTDGMVVIKGLNYSPDDPATASIDTFGEVHLHSFTKEQLLALAEVATYAAAHAEPLPD